MFYGIILITIKMYFHLPQVFLKEKKQTSGLQLFLSLIVKENL